MAPRTFTRADLQRITCADFDAMSPEDQRAYNAALLAEWDRREALYLSGDDDQIGSYRRSDWGA